MERIMIIDSEINQVRDLVEGLSDEYRVLGCSRGTKSLELFKLYQPSALVLEPSTFELKGKEFIRQVRSLPRGRRIPIFALTQITTLRHIEDSFDLDVDMIFSKPCSSERIKKKLNQYFARSASQPELELASV